MANVYAQNNWKLDTAGVILTLGNKIKIQKIVYIPNAIDNDLILEDGNGEEIWRVRAIAAGANFESVAHETLDFAPDGKWFDGFEVATIDGGYVQVYIA